MTLTVTEQPQRRRDQAAMSAARTLAADLEARAGEGDTLRTMPNDLVQLARTAGLFRLNLPTSLGGLELDPLSTLDVLEELCRADGSAGWTIMIGNSTAFFAWLDPPVAHALIGGDPDFVSTSVWAPTGTACPSSSGQLDVTGSWGFNSGCKHADWFQVGVMVMDGDAPRVVPGRGPDWRFAFVRAQDAEVLDTWDTLGLRGTGSHDVRIRRLVIPEEHTAAVFHTEARHDGPLWRLPLVTLATVCITAFPLGVAKRALAEFGPAALVKRRPGAAGVIAEDAYTQVEIARTAAGLAAARAYMVDVVGEIWDAALAGNRPTVDQRGRLRAASIGAMEAAQSVVDSTFHLSGGSAVYWSHPLSRCFRDIHTGGQHIIFSRAGWAQSAKVRFGLEQDITLL